MKKLFLFFVLSLVFTSVAFAQSADKPDMVTISRESVMSSARACAELVTAFNKGELYIKELEAENTVQNQLLQLQTRQLETLKLANQKLTEANDALRLANDSLSKALALAQEQHVRDVAALEMKDQAKGKKGKVVAVLKIGAVVGASVACGNPICGVTAAVGMESVPLIVGKKGKK